MSVHPAWTLTLYHFSCITSAVVRPDGTLLSYQPYGQEGLLIADLDLATATGLLAARCRTAP